MCERMSVCPSQYLHSFCSSTVQEIVHYLTPPSELFSSFSEAALLAIKASLVTPETTSWTAGSDPCKNWSGVGCQTLPDGSSTVFTL